MASKDLVAASSRPLVLSILAAGENYGYSILQEVKRLSKGELEWTDGMLYPVLHRLEREGLIQARWRTAETGRKRKYYRLSANGGRELETQRQQWMTVHRTLNQAWRALPCSI
jgi:DNA-binding PadR family transcriptional regulator